MNRAQSPLSIPTVIANSKAKHAAAEYRRLVDAFNAESRKHAHCEDARMAAEHLDREAFAGAIRAGRPDPGSGQVEQANAALMEARRRMDATGTALEASRRDLIAAVRETEPGWRGSLDRELEKRRAALKAQVQELARAHANLSETVATRGWLERFVEEPDRSRWNPAGALSRLPSLSGANREPVFVAQALDALTALAEPPAPRAQPAEKTISEAA